MRKAASKWICMNLPKRLELSLRTVLAFPSVSRTGFVDRRRSSTPASPLVPPPAQSLSIFRHCFVVSVFPAPDSPLMRIACAQRDSRSPLYAAIVVLNGCGALSGSPLAYSATCWAV